MEKTVSVICAEWDCNKADTKLGHILLFIKEIDILASENEAEIEVYIYAASLSQKNWIEALFSCSVSIYRLFWSVETGPVNDKKYLFCWPGETDLSICSWTGSTKWLQKSFLSGKNWPMFSKLHPPLDNYIACDYTYSIAVHLKYVVADPMSNASFFEWQQFFNYAFNETPEVLFLIIGDDDVPATILEMKNVIKVGGSVTEYMAVLAHANAFMGMSSGFCNYAILNDRPYRIWKQPGHHTEHMMQELGDKGQFAFVRDNQKFIIGVDNKQSLVDEFLSLKKLMMIEG